MPLTTIYRSRRSLGLQDSTTPAVETTELARLFGHSAALAGISIRVEPASLIALVGPNGAGKTTLLRILATALRPSFGTARVDGLDVASHADQVRPRVAYLSHATGLYDDLTGRENLRFAARLLGLATDEAADRIEMALEEVRMADVADERVRGHSAGMRKRIALARILLGTPSLVLLDEPHAALDAEGMALVDRMLGAWREVGVTVLLASHATDRVAHLVDGSVELDGGLVAEVTGRGATSTPFAPLVSPEPVGSAR
ncbi:MAG TPA: heme ABC exporter ATP-binding protein CcmA [Candidatus Limnocylindria bacterium]|nr:heme ABC exporter ATP-binding protein CcmA [Candidatus Limnocylindria bacterium]